jgi:hypothetical protein
MNHPVMLGVGLEVQTREGKTLGKIKRLGAGTFEVEKGIFLKRDYSVSDDEVAFVDGGRVVLAISMEELAEMRRHGALGTTLGERLTRTVDHAREAVGQGRSPSPKA